MLENFRANVLKETHSVLWPIVNVCSWWINLDQFCHVFVIRFLLAYYLC